MYYIGFISKRFITPSNFLSSAINTFEVRTGGNMNGCGLIFWAQLHFVYTWQIVWVVIFDVARVFLCLNNIWRANITVLIVIHSTTTYGTGSSEFVYGDYICQVMLTIGAVNHSSFFMQTLIELGQAQGSG